MRGGGRLDDGRILQVGVGTDSRGSATHPDASACMRPALIVAVGRCIMLRATGWRSIIKDTLVGSSYLFVAPRMLWTLSLIHI